MRKAELFASSAAGGPSAAGCRDLCDWSLVSGIGLRKGLTDCAQNQKGADNADTRVVGGSDKALVGRLTGVGDDSQGSGWRRSEHAHLPERVVNDYSVGAKGFCGLRFRRLRIILMDASHRKLHSGVTWGFELRSSWEDLRPIGKMQIILLIRQASVEPAFME